jgi:uncharacterized membrane protein
MARTIHEVRLRPKDLKRDVRARHYGCAMTTSLHLGKRIAPPRFVGFMLLLAAGVPALHPWLGWRHGTMVAFDVAAAIFLLSLWPLLSAAAQDMRRQAERNDANRVLLLAITGAVMLVVLVAVGAELGEKAAPKPASVAIIVATLLLSWIFSNMVYALHYAHMFYTRSDAVAGDSRGLDFPDADEPNYWDFIYFSMTLGMTFQTSDVSMTQTRVRIVATFHCFAAFVFNLGILAFTVNTLGSS